MGQPTEVSAKSNVKFAKIDNSVFDPEPDSELDSKTETPREKIQRQRRERHEQSEKTWAYVQANDARYAAHRANISKHKNIDLGEFNLEDVLAHPELDAVKPVKIDPASMLADDIESLMKEGEEFVKNPTLAGAASMAVIAIPGKIADKVIDKIPVKKIVKTIEYGDGKAIYHVDADTGLTLYSDGLITGPHPKRGKGILPNPVGGRREGEHRGHLIPEGGFDNPSFVNVSENLISESPNSNLGLKKILDLKASKIAAQNPNSEVRFMSEPIRKIGETRPFAVTHYIVKDGEIIDAVSVLNK